MAYVNGETWTVDRGGLNGPVTYTWNGARWLAPGVTAPAGAVAYNFRASDATWLPIGAVQGAIPLPPATPVIASINPDNALIGTSDLTMTVIGSGFDAGSVIVFNGGDEATAFVSATALTTVVKPSLASVAGTFPVTVRNSDGQVSNPVGFSFTVPWYEDAAFADYAMVLDFGNDRYALPALSGSDPILTRVGGAFPKREVSFSEAMQVTRHIPINADYPGDFGDAPADVWQTYDRDTGTWSVIGDNEPRLEHWFGRQSLFVEPHQRFNRWVSAGTPATDRIMNVQQGWYVISYLGTGSLSWEGSNIVTGGITPAVGSDAHSLQWGMLNCNTGGGGSPEFTVTGDVRNVTMDIIFPTDNQALAKRDPATFIPTGEGPSEHVERGPEHYSFNPTAFAHTINQPHGTLITELQMWSGVRPDWPDWRMIYGYDDQRHIMGFEGPREAYPNGCVVSYNRYANYVRTALPSADLLTSRVRVGLAWQNDNQRKVAVTGGTVTENTPSEGSVANGLNNRTNFWLGCRIPDDRTDRFGEDAGAGGWDLILWSPEYLSDATFQAIVDDV